MSELKDTFIKITQPIKHREKRMMNSDLTSKKCPTSLITLTCKMGIPERVEKKQTAEKKV